MRTYQSRGMQKQVGEGKHWQLGHSRRKLDLTSPSGIALPLWKFYVSPLFQFNFVLQMFAYRCCMKVQPVKNQRVTPVNLGAFCSTAERVGQSNGRLPGRIHTGQLLGASENWDASLTSQGPRLTSNFQKQVVWRTFDMLMCWSQMSDINLSTRQNSCAFISVVKTFLLVCQAWVETSVKANAGPLSLVTCRKPPE